MPASRDRSRPVRGEPVGVSTGRLEAFSDGVIAVAITLLVLNIHVPVPPLPAGHTLGHELADQWPVYAAYVTSFVTLGICAAIAVFYALPIASSPTADA